MDIDFKQIQSLCNTYNIERLYLLERTTDEGERLFVAKTPMKRDSIDYLMFEGLLSGAVGGCGLYDYNSEVLVNDNPKRAKELQHEINDISTQIVF